MIYVFDKYFDNSIKHMTRLRRGQSIQDHHLTENTRLPAFQEVMISVKKK